MLLVIDLGNTNTVLGVYEDNQDRGSLRLTTQTNMTWDEAGLSIRSYLGHLGLAPERIEKVVLASVVPPLTAVYARAIKTYLNCTPIVVSADIKLPVKIDIDRPEQVGADRLANAAAGLIKYGAPVIVVDFGTATNFDIVNEKGAYIGGILLPGPQTSMAQLARKAARLFVVEIEEPKRVVGRSTEEALRSGLFYGTVGQVDALIEKIIKETGFRRPQIVATGGLAQTIAEHSRYIQSTDPSLTLEGLRLIGELN